jgi:hypothetical protein
MPLAVSASSGPVEKVLEKKDSPVNGTSSKDSPVNGTSAPVFRLMSDS